ncbi:sensor histidine kinase [Chryseolinea lacunae]|uniref:Histidine kinase n=1 Tax=Chryseolinea lacunae TaxID=2801331 RepID=A0ABS1L5T2_9BACT|nr:histidine kinase [Chryseolinea lacunae]MBL0745881.1 histidine kinase [Chryseolinea lacunae]
MPEPYLFLKKVKEYIGEVSNVYRYLLQYKENDMVAVEDELKFTESYLYILSERFESGLQVEISIGERTRKTSLPPLALQTLVENAVKHNIVSPARPLYLEITDNDEFIVVRNNLQLKHSLPNDSSQSGLKNIHERYGLLANKEIVIEKTATHFIVKLPVLV